MSAQTPDHYDFRRYLAAKRPLDDRSLNPHVWRTFWEALPASSRQYPLEFVEFGAGTGTMIDRIIDSNLLNYATYTAVDNDAANIEAIQQKQAGWLEKRPHLTVFPRRADVYDFVVAEQGRQYWDGVLGHAFVDLVDVDAFLPAVFSLLPGGSGLFYFTLTFDGGTIFQPTIDPELDARIERAYHATMDARAGGSRSGRRLLDGLVQHGAAVLAAGSSDWVVYPQEGGYAGDEAYFLYHILHFCETSLRGHPDVDSAELDDWLRQRRQQVADGRLIYIAHQLDVTGRVQ